MTENKLEEKIENEGTEKDIGEEYQYLTPFDLLVSYDCFLERCLDYYSLLKK